MRAEPHGAAEPFGGPAPGRGAEADGGAEPVRVTPVTSAGELRAFVRLPWGLYRGDPNWVPPLMRDVKRSFDPETHPFHLHSDVQPYLALRGRRPVGRIAAIHNRRHVEFHEEPVGFFGFFESVEDPEVARALFRAAGDWLGTRGLEVMRGPTSFSTNEETGLLVEGFDRPPVLLMPYNPRYYPELLLSAGFRPAKTLVAYMLDDDEPPDWLTKLTERIRRKHDLTVRPLDMSRFDRELRIVRDLYNAAWEKNWGFVPMTDAEFEHMASELRPIVEEELALFAEDASGRAVGFVLSVPDMNVALRHADGRLFPFGLLRILWHRRKIDRIRVLALGVLEEYRGKGVDALLYHETFERGRRLGYTEGEFSWILEENRRMRRPLDRIGARVYKRYRLYDLEL